MSKSTQYTALDTLILNAVAIGRNPLYANEVCEEADRLATLAGREGFRVIDGRLQALRKSKKIQFASVNDGPRRWLQV